MSTSVTVAVLSFAGALGCCAKAMIAVARRRGGRIAWRGVAIGYRPRALFLALMAIGFMLSGVADLLVEADRTHPAYLTAMTALAFVGLASVVSGLAGFAARRRA